MIPNPNSTRTPSGRSHQPALKKCVFWAKLCPKSAQEKPPRVKHQKTPNSSKNESHPGGNFQSPPGELGPVQEKQGKESWQVSMCHLHSVALNINTQPFPSRPRNSPGLFSPRAGAAAAGGADTFKVGPWLPLVPPLLFPVFVGV